MGQEFIYLDIEKGEVLDALLRQAQDLPNFARMVTLFEKLAGTRFWHGFEESGDDISFLAMATSRDIYLATPYGITNPNFPLIVGLEVHPKIDPRAQIGLLEMTTRLLVCQCYPDQFPPFVQLPPTIMSIDSLQKRGCVTEIQSPLSKLDTLMFTSDQIEQTREWLEQVYTPLTESSLS